MTLRKRICLSAVLGCSGALALGAPPALASSTVSLTGGVLTVIGDGGVNTVTVGLDPAFPLDYRITDTAGLLGLPPGCVFVDATTIRCPASAVKDVQVALGAGDDSFSVLTPGGIPEGVIITINGEEGNDTINGRDGPGLDQLVGGVGDDKIFGLAGDDRLYGGDGDDELDGGAGDDLILGDAGNDIMDGGGGKDRMVGGLGNDIMNGLGEADTLLGQQGDDKLKGGGGKDNLKGGPGKKDVGIGGGGTDKGSGLEKEKGIEK